MRKLALIATLAALAACVSQQAPGIQEFGRIKTSSIRGQDPTRGRLFISFVREGAEGDRQVARLPTAYASASVTLSSSSGLLTAPLTRAINLTTPATQSLTVFSKLRPGSGYGLDVNLFNGVASVAKGKRTGVTLSSGINQVTVIMGVTGDIAITTSNTGNTIGDTTAWIIAKGDTVTFDTGFGSDEQTKYLSAHPGRSLVLKVSLGDGLTDDLTSPAAVDTLLATASAPFQSFTWDTSVPTPHFDPALLTTTGTQASRIKFQIVDDLGAIVGESILQPVSVIGAASIDLALQ